MRGICSACTAGSFCLAIAMVAGVTRPATVVGNPPLAALLGSTHWVSYAPTGYFPAERPPVWPSSESVAADLSTLREGGFSGLVTYGAELSAIPSVAARLGFKALLLGIWDPTSEAETRAASDAARKYPSLLAGFIVGNEGLMDGRYDVEAVCASMRALSQATGKPVSTTEPVDWVLSEPRIAECSTFLTVNAHPFFAGERRPADAVAWTVEAWNAVHTKHPDKPVLFKEVGLPSAGSDGLSEEAQAEYYTGLARSPVVFAYFEAFDATPRFKAGLIEQSWGLWRSDRRPKPVVRALPWRERR